MNFTVTIRGENTRFDVETGRTMLDAAIEAGAPVPFSCRSGNCGTCKCRLVDGEVDMIPYSEFALTESEKDSGLILACRAVPWSDCEIELLGEDERVLHPLREMTCRVAEMEQATHDIKILRLTVEDGGPYDFSPGQYAQVTVPGFPPRDYSMANQPDDPQLEFHIRHMRDGRVSGHVAEALAVGDIIEVRGPLGDAYLREQRTGPILAIAGGSGLAPIKAIVERAVALDPERTIHFYFGVRDERDLYLQDHFHGMAQRHPNFQFTPVLSEPKAPTERRTGLVTEAVKADIDDLDGFSAYLAGPPPMVEAAVEFLRSAGLGRERIHADAFYTAAEQQEKEAV